MLFEDQKILRLQATALKKKRNETCEEREIGPTVTGCKYAVNIAKITTEVQLFKHFST